MTEKNLEVLNRYKLRVLLVQDHLQNKMLTSPNDQAFANFYQS
jgi:hypothetical protein